MSYFKINATLSAPEGENIDGYNVHDYFTTDITALFPSRVDAEEAAKAGYKGPDAYGVGCIWTVDEVVL